MSYQQLKKKTEGFTIIEVLIVLAIAGLILLIVFLAVPALQRNSRNTQRNNEASRVSSAVTDCLANRNGDTTACDGTTVDSLAGNRQQLEDATVTAADPSAAAYSLTGVYVSYSAHCNAAGSAAEADTNARKFAVTFQLEPSVNRCIGSE